PLFVLRLDPATRRVVVGPKARLATAHVPLAEVNWLGDGDLRPGDSHEVLARVRSTREPKPAVLHALGGGRAEVELLAPEEGVSPGQACVVYAPEGSRVLGGGWIVRG
ncbi:MAG TPA: tRNA 2-thiouridine(34) synthase MnmA, partial [Paracoccaceae bacterium]|nr:tRNA 2-thiouridine(34) synthase MnmA [Paracoccaceae bacterium]